MFTRTDSPVTVKSHYLAGDASFLLDLLRVVACEMIVAVHIFSIYIFSNSIPFENTWPMHVIDFMAPTAVILFFFVSGIVISNSLFSKREKGQYGFTNYFIDRFARIYSGLLPCLIFILFADGLIMSINTPYYNTLAPLFGSPGVSFGVFLGSLFMIQSMPPLYLPQPPFAELLWTLNVEWWLYMLFGWAVIYFTPIARLITRPNVKSLLSLLVLAALSIFPVYNLLIRPGRPGSLVAVWFFGVLITALLTRGTLAGTIRRYFWYLFGLTLALTAVLIAVFSFRGIGFYHPVYELLIGGLLLLAIINYNGRGTIVSDKLKGFVKKMAGFSFTLYLINMVVIGLFIAADVTWGLHLPFAATFVVCMIATNLVAYGIAGKTEMKYKSVARWIKGKVSRFQARRPIMARARSKSR